MKALTRLTGESAQIDFGAQLWAKIKNQRGLQVIYLHGDLGAGKTTLVRGFVKAAGHEGGVKSPTYTLVESYQASGKVIHHFDLYRLADPLEFEYMGGQEYFTEAAICLIEWPEKAIGILPKPNYEIFITHTGASREINIKGFGFLI